MSVLAKGVSVRSRTGARSRYFSIRLHPHGFALPSATDTWSNRHRPASTPLPWGAPLPGWKASLSARCPHAPPLRAQPRRREGRGGAAGPLLRAPRNAACRRARPRRTLRGTCALRATPARPQRGAAAARPSPSTALGRPALYLNDPRPAAPIASRPPARPPRRTAAAGGEPPSPAHPAEGRGLGQLACHSAAAPRADWPPALSVGGGAAPAPCCHGAVRGWGSSRCRRRCCCRRGSPGGERCRWPRHPLSRRGKRRARHGHQHHGLYAAAAPQQRRAAARRPGEDGEAPAPPLRPGGSPGRGGAAPGERPGSAPFRPALSPRGSSILPASAGRGAEGRVGSARRGGGGGCVRGEWGRGPRGAGGPAAPRVQVRSRRSGSAAASRARPAPPVRGRAGVRPRGLRSRRRVGQLVGIRLRPDVAPQLGTGPLPAQRCEG